MARYIDVEVLIRKLIDEKNFFPALVAIAIDETPEADVVEVKHGEWKPYETEETYGEDEKIWYKCSVCGTDALGRCYEDEWYSYPIKSDICHKCGAKMDGGGKSDL